MPGYLQFARWFGVAIAGGESIEIPADVDVDLTAFALNGTWTGFLKVHGAAGLQEPVTISPSPYNAGRRPHP